MSETEINKLETREPEIAKADVTEGLWPSPGEKLKFLREELGYSKTKVAEELHMTVRYVTAMETDEYEVLPGKTFVKGYIKSYASLLKANVDEVLECYQQFSEALDQNVVSEAKVIQARKNYDQNKRWLICAAVIIVIVIAISWWYQ